MICPTCGAFHPDGTPVCSVCGGALPAAGQQVSLNQTGQIPQQQFQQAPQQQYQQAPQQQYQQAPQQQYQQTPQQQYQQTPQQQYQQMPPGQQYPMGAEPKKSPLVPILIASIIGVVVIAAVVILVIVLSKNKKDDSATASGSAVTQVTPDPDSNKAKKSEQTTEPKDDLPDGLDDLSDSKNGGKPYDNTDTKNNDSSKKKKDTGGNKNTGGDVSYGPGDRDNYTYDMLINSKLSKSDVEGLSSAQKQYYINTIYAYYGYRFKNEKIQSYFENQDWYVADITFAVGDDSGVSSAMNSNAKYNMKLLR